jgi:hypothetical protein
LVDGTSVDEALVVEGAGDTDDAFLKTVGDGEEVRIEEELGDGDGDGDVDEAFTTKLGTMLAGDNELLLA